MKRFAVGLSVVLAAAVVWAHDVAVLDDCDPNDPTWAPIGGCALDEGDVTRAEFGAFVRSPLAVSVVGHPAWRNEPSYLKIGPDDKVKVRNEGGRQHTFTEVANYGGGRVPGLNAGLTPALECIPPSAPTDLQPGDSQEVTGLGVGNHRFQCCIHPWMRALIKVKADED